ncbi:MAG: hypothetical protein H6855_03140 [Rhodospirillales bacterium]|nr:hypothetical protein [Rhodospirillales bacterium]MCB9973523.1 hypothetical protein [Rhodospirillales bacterium]MCB9980681.1 hypothetical protein [Rhodospirillales bacterium]
MTVSSSPITYDPTNSKDSNFPEALAAIIAEAANGKCLRVVATSPRSYEDPATDARNQFAAALSPHENISVETVREDQLPRIAPPDLTVSFSRAANNGPHMTIIVETHSPSLENPILDLDIRTLQAVTAGMAHSNPAFS